MPPPEDALRRYQGMAQKIRAHTARTTLFLMSSVVSNAVFGVWALLVYAFVEGECERPLRGLVLGCGVLFVVAAALSACLFALVHGLFYHVGEHSASAAATGAEYEPIYGQEPMDGGDGAVIVERAPHEDLARPVTDRISLTYCSFTCLVCGFGLFAVYLFTALTWVLVEKNNCQTAAPKLFDATRAYTYGLVGLFALHAVWFAFACRYCVSLCEVYGAQQRLTSYSASKNARKYRGGPANA